MEKTEIESESVKFRIRGNEIYKSCTDDIPFTIFKRRIYDCINMYGTAIRVAKEKEELCKAHKNLALCNIKIYKRMTEKQEKIDEIKIFYVKEAFKHYTEAIKYSENEEGEELISRANNLMTQLLDRLFSEEQFSKIESLKYSIIENFPALKGKYNFNLAKKYFSLALNNFNTHCILKSISYCEHSLILIREALFIQDELDDNFIEELLDLEESSNFLLIRSNAYRIIEKGDKVFKFAVFEDEEINMDYVKESVDYFREALLVANCIEDEKNSDIELEALISSKLGSIFYKIFKNVEKSEIYVKQSVELGLSLYPKNVHYEDWYREATKILKEIRRIKNEEEREKMKKLKEKYSNDICLIIKDLEGKAEEYSIEKFIKYILVQYPPTKELNYNVDEEKNKSNIKKVILKIIFLYHPDKFSSEDLKKKIIMEEITKILNRKYAYFK